MSGGAKPKKVAILGGGVAAMTAAWEITSRAPETEVTVYQLGWRLGGKGASGRNTKAQNRIEEHGLHVFLGFYQNAHRLMQKAYAEARRDGETTAHASWEEAFKPHTDVALMEHRRGRWSPWALPVMFDEYSIPGDETLLSGTTLAARLVAFLVQQVGELIPQAAVGGTLPIRFADGVQKTVQVALVRAALRRMLKKLNAPYTSRNTKLRLIAVFQGLLQPALRQMRRAPGATVDLRTKISGVDFALAALKGLVRDGAYETADYSRLDEFDLRAWLLAEGAMKSTVHSPFINGMYDLAFTTEGKAAAGTALLGLYRVGMRWEGAIFWKMQGGMGDVVFAPMYEVLKRRGVRFRFFHRIERLGLAKKRAPNGELVIDEIDYRVQAKVKGGGEYEPLIDIPVEVDGKTKTMACWPHEPLFEQLEEHPDFPNPKFEAWDDQTSVARGTLRLGEDFDQVVLGISIGAFPYVAKELVAASEPFRKMVEKVETTQTQAFQLWLDKSPKELGWRGAKGVVLDGFAPPFDTWADMSFLGPYESWGERTPKSIAYFCSDLPEPRAGDERSASERTFDNARRWIDSEIQHLWPKAVDSAGKLDRSLLRKAEGDTSEGLRSQYWTGTLNPSDRYVLATPGSTQFRLGADGSGVGNLALAGDWTRTQLNVGCVEAAVQSGMHAAEAILGVPVDVISVDANETVNGRAVPLSRRMLARSSTVITGKSLDPRLPRYIDRGGSIVLRAPIQLQGAETNNFLVSADLAKLQRIVDRELNEPLHGDFIYRVPAGVVAFVCAEMDRAVSLHREDRKKGYMAELDYGVWIPLVRGEMIGGVFVPHDVAVYQPYLFIDNVAAMASGREQFGYHKQTATLTRPGRGGAGSFAVNTLVIDEFTPNTLGRHGELYRITPMDGAVEPPPPEDPSERALVKELATQLGMQGFVAWAEIEWRDLDPTVQLARCFLPSIEQVMLRQFPDVENPDLARLQEVVSWRATVERWRGFRFTSSHTVDVNRIASHPLIEELGIPSTSESFGGVRMWYDFRVGEAELLARKP